MLNEDTPSHSFSLSPFSPLPLSVLCPEDPQSQETQSVDLTSTLETMSEGVVGMMEGFLTGDGGMKDLIKVITGNNFEAKPN